MERRILCVPRRAVSNFLFFEQDLENYLGALDHRVPVSPRLGVEMSIERGAGSPLAPFEGAEDNRRL